MVRERGSLKEHIEIKDELIFELLLSRHKTSNEIRVTDRFTDSMSTTGYL